MNYGVARSKNLNLLTLIKEEGGAQINYCGA